VIRDLRARRGVVQHHSADVIGRQSRSFVAELVLLQNEPNFAKRVIDPRAGVRLWESPNGVGLKLGRR
jgi:hypothetical protein